MPKDWLSGDVIANGIKIHTYRSGGDKPPIVLSHGITDSGLCWPGLAEVLEKDYEVITYDARGHGQSDAPAEGYAWEVLADDLAALIQALKLEKPRLLGHSLGAATVAIAAANHPDLARCAVLEDPPWRAAGAGPSQSAEEAVAFREEWAADLRDLKSKSREELIAVCRAENPAWPEVVRGPWADSKLQVSLDVLRTITAPSPSWKELLPRIACPILLITADPDEGAIVTPEVAREAAETWRQGEVVRIDGAGHNIRREQFGRYVAVVTAFLAKV